MVPPIPSLKDLAEAGAHFGHAASRWHPKMKPYIHATRDHLHILDLEQTRELLASSLQVLAERVRDGKTVIFVGTKNDVIANRIKEIGSKYGMPYINVRWPGGVLTNWSEVQKSIARMVKQEAFLASEDASKMIKKERLMMEGDVRRTQYKFGGLRDLTKKPDLVFMIDPSHEKIAVKEARREEIELMAVLDTNSDPTPFSHIIPINDDGVRSMKLVFDLIDQTLENAMAARQNAMKEVVEKAAKADK
jgi:small subunit ribosomal protein S2